MADIGSEEDRQGANEAKQVAGGYELPEAGPPAHVAEAILDVALQYCVGPQDAAGECKECCQGQADSADLGESIQGPANKHLLA